jgi:hypothetical protein
MLLLLLMFLMLLLLMVLLPLYGSTTAASVGVLAAADSAVVDGQPKQKLLDRLVEDACPPHHEVCGRLLREEVPVQTRSPKVMDHLRAAIRLCNSTVVVVVMVEVVVVVDFWEILLSLGFWAGPMSGVLNC